MKRSERYNDIESNGVCTAVLGSMTYTLKAQAALVSAAIRADVVKLSDSVTHKGCMYGLTFECNQKRNVETILANSRISVKQYIDGYGR